MTDTPSAPGGRVLLDYDGAAEYLETSYHHLRRLVFEKRIPYFKVGHKVRFDRDDLDAWLDARRVPAERAS